MDIVLPNDFTPRPYQERFMRAMDSGVRKAMWVVHRRGGKDLTAMHQTVKMMFQRPGTYWHIFPSFAQGRKAIWEGFRKDEKRMMENVFPGFSDPKRAGSIVKRKDEQQMSLELINGSIWRLMGSDRIEVVGAGPAGVVFSEYAIANPRARNMIRPMLQENGGWEVYITTPRGKNHAKDLYDSAKSDPEWFCELQTLFDTRAYDPEKTMAKERAEGMPEALIKQEYLCDWNAALVGSVWGDLVDALDGAGKLREFEHGRADVFTTWDLGFTDSTAIWFWQVTKDGIDLIDYYEEHGKPLSHYYDEVEMRGYRYIKHWLPHDARQTTLAAGVSILNQMLHRWPGQVAVGPDLPLLDGVQAVRWMLQQDVRIHPRCREGIEAVRAYAYAYDEDKKVYTPRPVHNWSSHAADALRYTAAVVKASKMLKPKSKVMPPVVYAKPLHRSVTLNELFEEHAKRQGARRRI